MLKDINLEGLLAMKGDDLRELLVDEVQNKQELRELIYRILGMSRRYKQAYEYEKEKNEQLTEKIEEDVNK